MTKMFLAHQDELVDLASGMGGAHPLGSALVVRLAEHPLADLSVAVQEHARAPWCPLVLAGHAPPGSGTLTGLGMDGQRVGIIDLSIDQEKPSILDVSLAISQRGDPDPDSFRRYVAARSGNAVAEAVGEALVGPSRWSSGLRRRLDRLDMPSPQHWLNLFLLTNYLTVAGQKGGRTLEQVALDDSRAPRTLSWWCAKYLRCTWPEARRRLGWEWVLESAIAWPGRGTVDAKASAGSPEPRP